jgi:ankyrin repeat protein
MDENQDDFGRDALGIAIEAQRSPFREEDPNNTNMIAMLIRRGARFYPMYGDTQLHCACEKNSVAALREFLAIPAEAAKINAQNDAGETPLHIAIFQEAAGASGVSVAQEQEGRDTDHDGRL